MPAPKRTQWRTRATNRHPLRRVVHRTVESIQPSGWGRCAVTLNCGHARSGVRFWVRLPERMRCRACDPRPPSDVLVGRRIVAVPVVGAPAREVPTNGGFLVDALRLEDGRVVNLHVWRGRVVAFVHGGAPHA